MFNIKIDDTLMTMLAARNVRIEELFVIACLNLRQVDQLQKYLRIKNHDQLSAYMQPLERKLLIKRLVNADEFSWDNFELTNLADQVFDECCVNIIEGNSLIKEPISVDKLDEFAEKFLGLFPEGVRNRGGEYLRTNKKDILSKMNTFVTKYRYSPETILSATERYLKQQAREQYGFCSAAHYFISKNGISKLASECEALRTNPGNDEDEWRNTLM